MTYNDNFNFQFWKVIQMVKFNTKFWAHCVSTDLEKVLIMRIRHRFSQLNSVINWSISPLSLLTSRLFSFISYFRVCLHMKFIILYLKSYLSVIQRYLALFNWRESLDFVKRHACFDAEHKYSGDSSTQWHHISYWINKTRPWLILSTKRSLTEKTQDPTNV